MSDEFEIPRKQPVKVTLSKKPSDSKDTRSFEAGPNNRHSGWKQGRRPEDELIPKKRKSGYTWIDYDPATIGYVSPFTGTPGSFFMGRINNAAQATGYWNNGDHPFISIPNNVAQIFTELHHKQPANDVGSTGYDINDLSPTVVGSSHSLISTQPSKAFSNDDPPFGSLHNLNYVPNLFSDIHNPNVAYGINNHAPTIIVGATTEQVFGDFGSGQAVRWDGLVGTKIFPSDGTVLSGAFDVNDSGVIVGIRAMQPFILHPTHGLVTLPTAPAVVSPVLARAINSSGQVIGTHTPTDFEFYTKGWFYDGTAIHNIVNPTPPVDVDFGDGPVTVEAKIEPWDLNDSGQVVGEYVSSIDSEGNETKRGFIWTLADGLVDLNTLLQPGTDFVITKGTGINNRGDIAATGFHVGIQEGAGRPFLGKKS